MSTESKFWPTARSVVAVGGLVALLANSMQVINFLGLHPRPSTTSASPVSVTGSGNAVSVNQTGGITANNVIVSQLPRLEFSDTIAEKLVEEMPTPKPISLTVIGSQKDQRIAEDFVIYLTSRGRTIFDRTMIGTELPPPEQKLSLRDAGDHYELTIAPNAGN